LFPVKCLNSINYHIIDSQHPLWFGHCCLHGRSLIHSLSAACAAEEKAVCIAEQAVFRRGKILIGTTLLKWTIEKDDHLIAL